MNYSKIRLNNERNQHVTKRLNRLNTWKFFTVLYRENIWRLFGFSLLMLVCLAPTFVVLILGSFKAASLQQGLPLLNGFGFSTGAWEGMDEYIAQVTRQNSTFYGLMSAIAALLATVILSGGFAVIRDAFWTGKFSAVGVFKSLWKGIKANVVYALISVAVIAFSLFGLFEFYAWSSVALPLWATIIIMIVLSAVLALVTLYLLTLCSVTVTYKQSVYENMDDAWRLMWLNFLPNLLHLIFALLPIPLYFVFGSGLLQSLFLVLLLMFGGLYFPLVWQSHMMRTFALFHPVEVKKKSQVKKEQMLREQELAEEQQSASAKKGKGKKQRNVAEEKVPAKVEAEGEGDPYAVEEDEYEVSDEGGAEESGAAEEKE